MTDPTPASAAPPSAAPPKAQPKWTRWVMIAAGIVLGLSGIAKLVNAFSLPSCESQTASDTVRSIYKSKDVELTKLDDLKTLTSSSSEKTCQGQLETADEQAMFDYKIFWDGWTVKVMITGVTAQPK